VAPAPSSPSSLELADGPMTALDLQWLRRAPEILLLSACDLALSARHPSDELLGLSTAHSSPSVRGRSSRASSPCRTPPRGAGR